jgi:hypothetical protein
MKNLLLIFFSISAAVFAQEKLEQITTLEGKTYINCTITKVEPDGLRIMHDNGVGKLFFDNLPSELQIKYNYDPLKAQQFKAEVKQQQAKIVLQNQASQEAVAKKQQLAAQREEIEKKIKRVIGKVIQVTNEGLLISCRDDVSYDSNRRNGGNLSAAEQAQLNNEMSLPPRAKDIIFLTKYPQREIIDGAWIETAGYPNGRHTYVNTMGAQTTIEKLTVKLD